MFNNERVSFQVQVFTASRDRWSAIGGKHERVYFNDDNFVGTETRTVEEAREAMRKIQEDLEKQWIKPRPMRIVKITKTITYETVE